MKNHFRRLTASFLVLILLSTFITAFAAGTDYADIKGHWAETTLIRALNDTLIEGTGNSLKPNDPITGAEILTILCHVLSVGRTADISGIKDIAVNDPYYIAASRAVALGITAPINGRLDLAEPVTRSKAFAELAEAFQLYRANPDTSVLSAYSDGNTLSGKYRLAAAALISGGFVQGFNGSLHINNNITRAEFLTVLYQIIPNYLSITNSAAIAGGAVYSGNTALANTEFSGNVFFDGAASDIQLQSITAPAVILRGDSLNSLSISTSKIDRLVFAAGSGDLYYSPDLTSVINTVDVGTGGGTLTFGGNISNVEITGSSRDVTLNGSVKNLIVSGNNNKIIVASGVTVDAVKILGDGNTVTLDGACLQCDIYGPRTVLEGSGSVRKLVDNSKGSSVTAAAEAVITNKDYGLNGVTLTMTAPDNVASYETLKASVSIKAPAGSKMSHGVWYLDDKFISQAEVNVGKTSTVSLNTDIKDRSDVPVTSTLSYVLSYINSDGVYQEIRTDKSITLLNKTKFDPKEILALVTTGYKGDYTLKWAQANDYDSAVKTEWVNLKGYSSKTNYLVWVNITYQRVNIFSGSAGNWKLEKTFIVGTGATGKDTPVGVFKVIGRTTKGWTTKAYTVKPVIYFLNTAYGFHSRLYNPGTTTINDPRIGFPVSHGCIRMYDEDVAWFYKNIATNTTVVVY